MVQQQVDKRYDAEPLMAPAPIEHPPEHIADRVVHFLEHRHRTAWTYWTSADTPAQLLDLCDVAYSLRLVDRLDCITPDAPHRFAALLRSTRLKGGVSGENAGPSADIHLTAYALGVLNLLRNVAPGLHDAVFDPSGWRFDELIDAKTLCPRWRRVLSHHSWRSSHWVGGAPSILLSLSRAAPDAYARHGGPPVADVLAATDKLLDPRTGFLKLYHSRTLHAAFNTIYRLRHEPRAAEIGGVAHVHWINYVLGRPYVASESLWRSAVDTLPRARFMEATPYCLDFDILHIVRTAAANERALSIAGPIKRYAQSLEAFYGAPLSQDYRLHRLPGGLAALHECALLLGAKRTPGLATAPIDIISEAYWL